MASAAGRGTSGSRTSGSRAAGSRSSGTKKGASSRKPSGSGKKSSRAYQAERDYELFREIGLIVLFVAMVLLFLCNFGMIGVVGDVISGVLFGLFGWTAYLVPVAVFVAVAFWFANEGSATAVRKLAAGVVLFLMLGMVCELIGKNASGLLRYDIAALYQSSKEFKNGGGVLAGSLTYLSLHYLETIGTIILILLCSVICVILMTEKLVLSGMREKGSLMRERSRENSERRRQIARARLEEREARRQEEEEARCLEEEERGAGDKEEPERTGRRRREHQEARRQRAQEREDEKILRINKRAVGVTIDTSLNKRSKNRDDIHEITMDYLEEGTEESPERGESAGSRKSGEFDFERISIRSDRQNLTQETENTMDVAAEPEQISQEDSQGETAGTDLRPRKPPETQERDAPSRESAASESMPLTREAESIPVYSEATGGPRRPTARLPEGGGDDGSMDSQVHKEILKAEKKVLQKYIFPPYSKLQKGPDRPVDSSKELRETAMRLQQTLATFGVRVTITDISQGPSVTRYEMQPEQGVKVSKIVGLADDIKLNLAATDIRIEAPIPGKAAVGIEVPNKENMVVALRDLLESREFKAFPSNLAFAVGKDIAGQVVVSDIAKMPHMLIAGATGSGKSVCINTLIMSILYKAHPDDVKLIMVDPKVVELSVYNGIPHLLIPVVTDPKKASAALHWGVSEMNDRYKKFADFNVRDLKGYNKKIETMKEEGQENVPAKLPQIVIIVDELADLMMVAPGEVEESICRLAQLARAAGIHLIIATQRPSVDVITGLIKANMPSRVAFAVSSGVDSRTILDMVGAEKLLGKGDMLFYPQGYSKPARIQGAFVSDKEVSDVVDFLKNQAIGNVYSSDVEAQIKNLGSGAGTGSGGGSERDEYFEEAGRFVIEKEKATIGALQRLLKIGFNRAARIIDQLEEYGVVGEEEGTKPRKVLMSEEEFERLLEELP